MVDLAQLELKINSLEVVEAVDRLNRFSTAGEKAEQGGKKFEGAAREMSRTAQALHRQLSDLVRTVGLLAVSFVGLEGIKSGVETLSLFEEGLRGIEGTAHLTEVEVGALDKSFKELAADLAVPIERLFQLGKAAGSVGVRGVEDITRFTSSVAKLEKLLPELRNEETVNFIARLLNTTGEGIGTIEKFSGALLRLAADGTATGNEILGAAKQFGAALVTFHLSAGQLAAIGATIIESGQNAERAGATLSDAFLSIDRAVVRGGESLERFAAIAGVSTDKFANTFKQDKVAGLQLFVEGLRRVVDNGGNIEDVLGTVGIKGAEAIKVFGALAVSADVLASHLKAVGEGQENARLLSERFARDIDTLEGAFQRLKNTGIVLVNNLLSKDTGIAGGLRAVVDAAVLVVRTFAGLNDENDKASAAVLRLATVLRLLTVVIASFAAAGLVQAITAISVSFGGMIPLTGLLALGLGGAVGAATNFNTALITTAAVVAAVQLAPLIERITKSVTAFFNLRDVMNSANAVTLKTLEFERDLDAARVASTQALLNNIQQEQARALVTVGATTQAQALAQAEVLATAAIVRRTQAAISAAEAEKARLFASASNLAAQGSGAAPGVRAAAFGVEQQLITLREKLAVQTAALAAAQADLNAVTTAGATVTAAKVAGEAQVAAVEAALVVETETLAATNAALAVAEAEAAVASTFLGRTLLFVRTSIASVTAAIAANPLGAFLVALALVVPLLINFSHNTDDATESIKRLKEAQDRLKGSLEGLHEAEAAEELAQRKNNREDEIKAIEQQIQALKGLQQTLQATKSAGPVISFDDLKKIKVPDEAITALKNDLRSKFGPAIIGALQQQLDQQPGLKFVISGGLGADEFARNEKIIREFTGRVRDNLKQIGIDLDAIGDSAKLKAGLGDLFEAFAKFKREANFKPELVEQNLKGLQTAIGNLVDSVSTAAPVDQALNLVDARIDSREEKVKKLQAIVAALVTTDVRTFSPEELAAQGKFTDLEKKLKLERELASETEKEAGFRRQLAEIRSVGETTGLSKEALDKRLSFFELLLRTTDAITEQRKAQEAADESRKEGKAELDAFLVSLQQSVALAGKSADEQEREREVAEALSKAKKAERTDTITLIAEVIALVTQRQKNRHEAELEIKAQEDLKRATEELLSVRKRSLETASQDVKRSIDSILKEVERLDDSLSQERAGLLDREVVEGVTRALASFQEQAAQTVVSLGERRDAALRLAKTEQDEIVILRAYNADVRNVAGSLDEFKRKTIELAQIKVFESLKNQARELDAAFNAFFKTDQENRLDAGLKNIKRDAQELIDLFTFARDKGIIDETSFEDAKRGVEQGVVAIKAKLEELAKLDKIKEAAQQISRSFGDAFKSFLLGAKSGKEAALDFARSLLSLFIDKAIIEPLVENLSGALSKAGANLAGIKPDAGTAEQAVAAALGAAGETAGTALGTGGEAAATAMTTAGETAGGLLRAGGFAAGAEIEAAAGRAAALLSSLGTAKTVSGFIGAGVGAGTGVDTGEGGGQARGGVFAGGQLIQSFARGAAIDRGLSSTIAALGNVPTFAGGSVVSGPHLIPKALIGEGARPEGILPLDKTLSGHLGVMAQIIGRDGQTRRDVLELSRLADGNLGVKVQEDRTPVQSFRYGGLPDDGAGFARFQSAGGPVYGASQGNQSGQGNQRPISISVVQNIKTPDQSSFRKNERQQNADARRAARRLGRGLL